jgi:DUF4097 and DUF4098 domain-containing protein YvlB
MMYNLRKENTMAKKFSFVLAFSFALFITSLGSATAEEINKEFHQSFDVKSGDSLRLRHGDGDVRLIPWEKDIIDVKVRHRADRDVFGIRLGRKHEFNVEFRQTANTVYVTGKETSSATIGYQNKNVYEYIYEIHSPDYIKLDLEGDDGNVEIESWKAEIECRVDDGDINLRNIVGDKTTIWGEDGDVEIDNLTGEITIKVDDGDVHISGCETMCCRLEAEDGNITLSRSKGSFNILVDDGDITLQQIEADRLDIRAEDGDLDLDLMAVGMFEADIRTDDGDITVDLEKGFSTSFYISADDADYIRIELDDVEDFKEDRFSKSGSVHGGEGRMKIRTADGNITIKEKY